MNFAAVQHSTDRAAARFVLDLRENGGVADAAGTMPSHSIIFMAGERSWWTVRSAHGYERVSQPAARGAHGPPLRLQGCSLAGALFILLMLVFPGLRAAEGETMADRSLRRIVDRQRDLLAEAAKQGDKLDPEAFRTQAQSIAHDYELLLRNNPNFATAFAAYGYWLGKVGMAKEAAAMLLKANQLDPNIPLVKNQLGNHLAEDGKPLQAAPYFIAAIKLAPNEPLYHYQLGTLLVEARDEFLKSGEWSRATLDQAMHHAFQRAAELAPDRFEFAYRYAESFYDLERPDWDAALKAWSALEEKAPTTIERQTMRLHAANICLKLGKRDHAKALLATVDEAGLQGQKQKLIAQLAETPKK